MRILKPVLIALLLAVSVLFALTQAQEALSGAKDPPTIRCDVDLLEVSVSDGDDVLLSGVTATDPQDGDLTGKILIQGISTLISNDTAKISYVVFDSDGNAASCTRQIRYTDYEKPHFSLTSALVYQESEDIELLDRLQAVDVIDGDITDSIRVSSLAYTSDAEISTVTVQVTNSMGDTARLTLPLVQYSGTVVRPVIELTEYLVYLDQGASFTASSYLSRVTTSSGQGDRTQVQITGTVDTSTPDTYYVYYRYAYNMTTAVAVLTVVVE